MRKLLSSLLLVVALIIGIGFWAASPPDRIVRFEREAVSELPVEQLGRSLSRYRRWSEWHHEAVDVRLADQGPEVEIATGSMVRFQMEPKGKPWKKFELDARVVRYEPNRSIRLKLVRDSTNRIPDQFDDLQWEVSLEPISLVAGARGTRIHAVVEGHTRNWRSRMFARIAPHILMNQVLYVDLFRLAGMDTGSGLDLSPRE